MIPISELSKQAQDAGVFLPLSLEIQSLAQPDSVCGQAVANRAVLVMQPGLDADANGAPTEATAARYCAAVRKRKYGMVWLEPAAITPSARRAEGQPVLCEENLAAFQALIAAVQQAHQEAYGSAPLMVALLDHAGHRALDPVALEHNPNLPTAARLVSDDELMQLVIACANAVKTAAQAGFSAFALNAAGRNLFGESLAAFHRDGRFGGDFDDRSRFVRDCYTAMKMTAGDLICTIRLSLSDGIPQPDGWGMSAFHSHVPDVGEPILLLKILQALYGLETVLCDIGIPNINWLGSAERESDLIRVSRLCTCIAMMDSDMQEHIKLIVPQIEAPDIPFENLAAGMIVNEFASFAGYSDLNT